MNQNPAAKENSTLTKLEKHEETKQQEQQIPWPAEYLISGAGQVRIIQYQTTRDKQESEKSGKDRSYNRMRV